MNKRGNTDVAALWTLTLSFVLLLAFKLEQFLVFVTSATSPKDLLESAGFPLNLGVYIISPILHSDGGHIATNLFWLILFGTILEQRVDLRDYLGFILGVGILGNFVAPFLGQLLGLSVAFAIGVSGATNALGMRETIYRFVVLSNPDKHVKRDWMIFLIACSATALSALIILQGETQPGNSVVAHGVGLLFGAVFAIAEVDGFHKSYGRIQRLFGEEMA